MRRARINTRDAPEIKKKQLLSAETLSCMIQEARKEK